VSVLFSFFFPKMKMNSFRIVSPYDPNVTLFDDTRNFCMNLKANLDLEQKDFDNIYVTFYGDSYGKEWVCGGKEKVFVMKYNAQCLSILDENGKVECKRSRFQYAERRLQ